MSLIFRGMTSIIDTYVQLRNIISRLRRVRFRGEGDRRLPTLDMLPRKESPMKAIVSCFGALLVALAFCSGAQAQHPFFHGCGNHAQTANAFTPSFMGYNYY